MWCMVQDDIDGEFAFELGSHLRTEVICFSRGCSCDNGKGDIGRLGRTGEMGGAAS